MLDLVGDGAGGVVPTDQGEHVTHAGVGRNRMEGGPEPNGDEPEQKDYDSNTGGKRSAPIWEWARWSERRGCPPAARFTFQLPLQCIGRR
jgi:hypothetical protein